MVEVVVVSRHSWVVVHRQKYRRRLRHQAHLVQAQVVVVVVVAALVAVAATCGAGVSPDLEVPGKV